MFALSRTAQSCPHFHNSAGVGPPAASARPDAVADSSTSVLLSTATHSGAHAAYADSVLAAMSAVVRLGGNGATTVGDAIADEPLFGPPDGNTTPRMMSSTADRVMVVVDEPAPESVQRWGDGETPQSKK